MRADLPHVRRVPSTRAALFAALAAVLAGTASAQHAHAPRAPHGDPTAVAEAFVVEGLRVDPASPPPGSAVGRAGLRYHDGGYVSVVYGRPYARGRVLWGGLVSWDAVWSAGAHRATELVTTVPLTVGGTVLPPGAYSLLVTPRAEAPWTLHVNRTLGAHLADEHDASDDLATATAPPEALAEPVDALTWAFADSGRALVLSWGRTRVSFPIARTSP